MLTLKNMFLISLSISTITSINAAQRHHHQQAPYTVVTATGLLEVEIALAKEKLQKSIADYRAIFYGNHQDQPEVPMTQLVRAKGDRSAFAQRLQAMKDLTEQQHKLIAQIRDLEAQLREAELRKAAF